MTDRKEDMKLIPYLIYMMVSLIIIYFAASFIALDFNFVNWETGLRTISVGLWGFLLVLAPEIFQ